MPKLEELIIGEKKVEVVITDIYIEFLHKFVEMSSNEQIGAMPKFINDTEVIMDELEKCIQIMREQEADNKRETYVIFGINDIGFEVLKSMNLEEIYFRYRQIHNNYFELGSTSYMAKQGDPMGYDIEKDWTIFPYEIAF